MAKLKFIDINSSNVFDGSRPYVFWFDEGQSVNIQYVKQICFITKKQNVKVNIPDEDLPVFMLLDVSKININNTRKELDLDTLRTNKLTSTGYDYKGMGYVHMIYIIASSADAGEFIGTVNINGEPYSIGADFYIEDERLLDNLKNFGVEIPAYVQRAIYESNVKEPAIDNILMNRKWKELLLEYINIIANKGSYNSLINSLEWFEWGDLVYLQEYWKYVNYDKDWYRAFDLMGVTGKEIQTELKNYIKTTYIGLFAALDKLKIEDGDIEYEDHFNANEAYLEGGENAPHSAFTNGALNNETAPEHRVLQIGGYENTNRYNYISDENEYEGGETSGAWFHRIRRPGVHIIDEQNPKLEKVSFMWGFRDLALKMALLGRYYETYFMPIHLDLIHAALENKVYTNALKVLHACDLSRIDTIDQTTGVYCDVLDNSIFRLQDVIAYTYPDTPFSHQYDGGNWDKYGEDENIDVIGVDLTPGKKADVKTYVANMFGGIGAVVPINFTISNKDPQRMVIRTLLYDNDSKEPVDNYNIYTPSETGDINISATILIKTPGPHQLRFVFLTNGGEMLIKRLMLNIVDDSWQPIELYKVKRIENNILTNTETNELYGIFTFNNFVYSQQDKSNRYGTGGTMELSKYSQFLPYTSNPLRNSFGVNHMIKINTDEIEYVNVNGSMASIPELKSILINSGYKVDEYEDCCTPPAHYLIAVNPTFKNDVSFIPYYNNEIFIKQTGETARISVIQADPYLLEFSVEGIDIEWVGVECSVVGKTRTIPVELDESGKATINLQPTLNLYKTNDIKLHFKLLYSPNKSVFNLMDEDLYIQNIISSDELDTGRIEIIPVTSQGTPIEKEKDGFYISEYRIFPIFHTLEKLEGKMEVSDNELVVAVPNIPMTLKNKDITATWTFVNESTGKTISFKPKHYVVDDVTFDTLDEYIEEDLPVNQPIIYTIGDHVEKGTPLPRGYYSIKLDYSLDGKVINSSTLTHAFHKI